MLEYLATTSVSKKKFYSGLLFRTDIVGESLVNNRIPDNISSLVLENDESYHRVKLIGLMSFNCKSIYISSVSAYKNEIEQVNK